MLSNGGVIGIDVASQFPVRMIESGPAAGALAAAYFADVLGLDRLLSFDMGGTTAKACLIEDRKPLVTGDFEVDRIYRFKSGSGMPILIPSIDMIEIGAGGGSIASRERSRAAEGRTAERRLRPGPVAYGRGGTKPTVTDADLVLGYLDADNFLGGDMQLDRAGAEKQLGNWPRRSARRPSRPRPASTASSANRWPPRRAPTPPTAASTIAACRCWPSVAPGRCTPATSPSCWTARR